MKILHLITKADPVADDIIKHQDTEHTVERQDLTAGPVSYPELLEKVFEADSVDIW